MSLSCTFMLSSAMHLLAYKISTAVYTEVRTFKKLSSINLTRCDFQCDDMSGSFVEQFDRNSNSTRHRNDSGSLWIVFVGCCSVLLKFVVCS
jgi:hypothetical protein